MNTDEKARPDQAPAAETVVEQLIEKMRTCPREVSSAVVDDWAEELGTVLALLRAVPPAPPPEGRDWQPIETAPKDGTWILGYVSPHHVEAMSWGRSRSDLFAWCTVVGTCWPTHWMPLPDPPTEAR
jgi:hypothetical protein